MRRRGYALSLVLVLLLAGCGSGVDYKKLASRMSAGDCAAATRCVQKAEEYGRNQQLLHLMDAAAVNMYCGRYAESNDFLHLADQYAEDLWTKSLTAETAAFLLNDYTIPYSGEDFERALINMLSAVNYAVLSNYEDALVECRRLNNKLEFYNSKYEDKKNAYKEDAFGRYLSGTIYEAEDPGSLEDLDNAFIDYHKAMDAFKDYQSQYGTPVPQVFLEDYLRVAEATGRLDEALESPEAPVTWASQESVREMGRLVLIHLNGRAPVKEQDKVLVPTPRGPITLAFPRFVVRPPACRGSALVARSAAGREFRAETELVEDINAIALRNLEDRRGRVVLKTLARAAAKQAAIEGISRQMGSREAQAAARLGLNLLNLVVERADTRSWRTLPGEIFFTRMFVPPGSYALRAELCEGRSRDLGTVRVGPGETRFLLLDTIF
jgi:hypothetical protein